MVVEGVPRVRRHEKASHASATPVTNGTVVIAAMGSEGFYCYDMNGTLLWKADLGVLDVGMVEDPTAQWGPASSPIILDDLLIVQNDRQKESFLVAFDLKTGKERWRSARDEMPAWATPAVASATIITNSPRYIRGHDARDGRERWRVADNQGQNPAPGDAAGQVKVSTPVVAGDLVIVTSGYPLGGRPIYAIRVADGTLAWKIDRGSPYTPTPIAYQGLLYVIQDNGVLSTYDLKTGERVYQRRISDTSGGFSASPIAADGRLYFTSEDGLIYVVRAGRTFELLASNDMGEVCMATPAIAQDMLIVRTRSRLYALAAK
jgi:outer membrane protein assembly factor BamB